MSNTIELSFQIDTADDFRALCDLFGASKAKNPNTEAQSIECPACEGCGEPATHAGPRAKACDACHPSLNDPPPVQTPLEWAQACVMTVDEAREALGLPPLGGVAGAHGREIHKGDKLTVTVEPDKIAVRVNEEPVAENPRPACPGAWMWDAPREPDGQIIEAAGTYWSWQKTGLALGHDWKHFRATFTTEEGHARFAGHWDAICREREVSINGQAYRVVRCEAPRFENSIVTYEISFAPVKPPSVQTYNAPGGTRAEAEEDAKQAVEKALVELAKQERREREAPLVALVNAVPEGLDPIGWRAAVLAYAENFRHPWWTLEKTPGLAQEIAFSIDGQARGLPNVEERVRYHSALRCVQTAYQRAVAPSAARPHVETRQGSGVAFRSRNKGLPLDMGDG